MSSKHDDENAGMIQMREERVGASSPPGDKRSIGPEALCDGTLLEWDSMTHSERE